MNIQITSGIGIGPTELSAFDAALNNAGISNFNLLRLSSVIPPSSQLIVSESHNSVLRIGGEWGDRLYVVMAEKREHIQGREAWAGIGWVQEPVSGRGLFVEHEGDSEQCVRSDIQKSLEALQRTRDMNISPINMLVKGGTCTTDPVCSLVIAVYQAESWRDIEPSRR